MEPVKVYTIDYCPYCDAAKKLLNSRKIAFEEIHVDRSDTDNVQKLFARSGMRTFPQIFFGEKVIGGYTDLEALDRQGKLPQN